MNWIVINPEQVIALRDAPNFVSAEQYPKDIALVPGELGCLLNSERMPLARFIVQANVLPVGTPFVDHRPRTTVTVPLKGLPEVPELFRPVEEPLGLCPFPLTPVALASIPCRQEPSA